jgi:hypothetical protein
MTSDDLKERKTRPRLPGLVPLVRPHGPRGGRSASRCRHRVLDGESESALHRPRTGYYADLADMAAALSSRCS